jgi:hypothetical protein
MLCTSRMYPLPSPMHILPLYSSTFGCQIFVSNRAIGCTPGKSSVNRSRTSNQPPSYGLPSGPDSCKSSSRGSSRGSSSSRSVSTCSRRGSLRQAEQPGHLAARHLCY